MTLVFGLLLLWATEANVVEPVAFKQLLSLPSLVGCTLLLLLFLSFKEAFAATAGVVPKLSVLQLLLLLLVVLLILDDEDEEEVLQGG